QAGEQGLDEPFDLPGVPGPEVALHDLQGVGAPHEPAGAVAAVEVPAERGQVLEAVPQGGDVQAAAEHTGRVERPRLGPVGVGQHRGGQAGDGPVVEVTGQRLDGVGRQPLEVRHDHDRGVAHEVDGAA